MTAEAPCRGATRVWCPPLLIPHRPASRSAGGADSERRRELGRARGASPSGWRRPGPAPPSASSSSIRLALNQFRDPLIYLLLVAAAVSLAVQHPTDAAVILAVVAPKAVIGYVQEARARDAVRALARLAAPMAEVLRESRTRRVPARLGVAMGIAGSDVAREASDMVLADDNFATIRAAVEERRTVFSNVRKVTLFRLSTAVGEVLTILVALVAGWPLSLLAPQILWVHLVTADWEPRFGMAMVSLVRILVATRDRVFGLWPAEGELRRTRGPASRPTCLASERRAGRAWCGTEDGVRRSDDGGATWVAAGLEGEKVTAVAADPARPGAAWAGSEPSALYRSEDGGRSWERADGLLELPSSSEWSFPPRPETHHVRWIAPHPEEAGRLWVAIEAGALVSTPDGGATWRDRVPAGPYDTHEIAIHPDRPELLRIAAGDGYYESDDGGATWRSPGAGMEVGYLRSVAVDPGDPDVVVVSAASAAHSAYTAERSDGRLYRRVGEAAWRRVTEGWPREPETIAPLLIAGREADELWAADERGVHRSADGGSSWGQVARFRSTPTRLQGLALVETG